MSNKHQPASPQTIPALTAEYTHIADDLTYRYDGVFSRETVQQAVDQARATLGRSPSSPTSCRS